jgi:hypothetical protein
MKRRNFVGAFGALCALACAAVALEPTSWAMAQSIAIDSVARGLAIKANTTANAALPKAGGTMTGNLLFSADNSFDIGASGATRPRNLFVAGTSNLAGTVTLGNDLAVAGGTAITWSSSTSLKGSLDGALRWTKNSGSLPTVAGLPACNAGNAGARSFVTDANATTFASTVASGGTNDMPVYCDGDAAAWKIG